MVFSKSYCPYCKMTKTTLTEMGALFKAYELDLEGDGKDVQKLLAEMTGQKSVPNIFIGGQHIGGNDKL
jgi:glutaredoxin 3